MSQPTRQERGYDNRWVKLRNAKLHKDPLCEHCLAKGYTTPAKDVDHIVPFDGLDDPKRLDYSNLASVCRPCHNVKTHGSKVGCNEYGTPDSPGDWW